MPIYKKGDNVNMDGKNYRTIALIPQVKQFTYLGASFNEKGDTIKEVKSAVAQW